MFLASSITIMPSFIPFSKIMFLYCAFMYTFPTRRIMFFSESPPRVFSQNILNISQILASPILMSNISNTEDRDLLHFQTPRSELKIRRVAKYF